MMQPNLLTDLQESEARFRAAFQSSAIGMGLLSLDGRILQVNDAVLKISGYSEAELLQRYDYENVFPADRQIGQELYRELLDGKRDWFQVERRYVRKNEEVFWTRLTISAVRGAQGKPLYFVGLIDDIDAQKKMLEVLQESEARFRATFESSAIGIAITTLDGHLLRANSAVCKISGYTEEELRQRTDYENTHPEDRNLGMDLFAELLEGKRASYQVEKRYVRKNGEVFWAQLTLSAVYNPVGRPEYLVAMVDDIEERKRALDNLRESEARFRALYDNVSIGMAAVSLDRQIISVNQVAVRMTGYEAVELIGRNPSFLSHPDDVQIGMDQFREMVAGNISSFQMQKRFIRKDGSFFCGRVTYSMVPDKDGRPLYLVGFIEDATEEIVSRQKLADQEADYLRMLQLRVRERTHELEETNRQLQQEIEQRQRAETELAKRAAERLHESDARFQALFDNVAVGVAVLSLARRPIAFNAMTEKIIGYSFDEIQHVDPRSLAVSEDRGMDIDLFNDLIEGKRESYVMERRYRHKDGSIFWARVNYSLVRDLKGKPDYLVGIVEDIDEQKRASERMAKQEADYLLNLQQRVQERTQELEETNRQLQQEIEQRKRIERELAQKAAEEAVTADRTRLARDLHDAVTQTLFSASLTAEVLPDLWEMDVEEAKRSTEELRQLTRGALAEMRTLLLELRPAALTQTRLNDLIRQLCEAFIGRSRLPIKLTIAGERELPPEVQIAFYRIAQESLNNVFKYARASEVDVNLFLSPSNVHFEVCDNGIGFDMSTSKPASLGMRIMRERAEAIGADLKINSTPGNGTCIEVTWHENPERKLKVM